MNSEHETHESTASVNDTVKNNAHSYESTTGKGEDHTFTTTTRPAVAAAKENKLIHSITESQDTARLSQESPLSSISLHMKKRGAHQQVRRDRSNVANQQHVDKDDDASDKVKSRGAALSNAGDSALLKLGSDKLVLSNPPTKAPPATLTRSIRPSAASNKRS
jgi:hypothetical protein